MGARRAPSPSSQALGENYKAEWIHEIPTDEAISLYRQGGFVDLCAGPHLPSTGQARPCLQADEGGGRLLARRCAETHSFSASTAPPGPSEKELKQYLFQLEEAEKRDHRRLGRELDLFHLQEEAAGSVFWHPKGWTLYRTIENYIRRPARRARAMSRCRRRSSSTARCGKPRAIGRNSASTCSRSPTRTAGASSP